MVGTTGFIRLMPHPLGFRLGAVPAGHYVGPYSAASARRGLPLNQLSSLVRIQLFHNLFIKIPPVSGGIFINGRNDWIRTSDPYVPNVVLYQAEPRSDKKYVPPFNLFFPFCQALFTLYPPKKTFQAIQNPRQSRG